MTPHSTSGLSSILEDGRLKPGIYKIQNIRSETYLDIEVHTREVCCRPAKDLEEGRGFKWEVKTLGGGYTVEFVEPGKPEQFCTRPGRLGDFPLVVAAYPVAWRVEVVDDAKHRDFEYVRFCWGGTNLAWNLDFGSKLNGAKVSVMVDDGHTPRRIWKLIPVKVEGVFTSSQSSSGTLGSGPLPPYDGDATGQSSTRTQHVEPEHDEFGTIVKEITVVTSIVTTHKKYRVGDA
ncbi:hypothetical protein BDM02DRAFT_3128113 [Thelephora ganbajun]|uniref:Uncharacterized protein n=1 Tax=Thelephora ganbajun TaxID=370292 RepID=A0ACB6ZJ95_THEGA|nr:hypothetical protein BDM02DRAFT_3128113 [Thelephora ganbajun]